MKERSGLKKSIIFTVFLLVFYFGGSYLTAFLVHHYNLALTSLEALLISELGLVLVPITIYFILTRENVCRTLKLHPLSLSCIFKVILFSFCIQPLITFIALIGNLFFTNYTQVAMTGLTAELSYPEMLLASAVIPAIIEESATRGIILSGYKGKPTFLAAAINGLIFAILHGNIQQGLYTFALGFIFVYLVNASGSIFSSMIAHFIINATSITMMYALSGVYDALEQAGSEAAAVTPGSPEMIIAYVIYGMVAIGFTSLSYLIYRSIKNQYKYFFKNHSNTISL